MRREPYALDVKAGNGAGTPFDVKQFINMTVVLRPGGAAGTTPLSVLQLQLSCSAKAVGDLVDADFIDYGAATDASGVSQGHALDTRAVMYLRVFTSGYVSGTPAADFCADNMRTF